MWAAAPNDVWVASGFTDALHFDGTTWTGTRLTDFGLFTIWGDGTQAYAGGEGEALFHFAGGSWTTLQERGAAARGSWTSGASARISSRSATPTW